MRSQLNVALLLKDRIRIEQYCRENAISKAHLISEFIRGLKVDEDRYDQQLDKIVYSIKNGDEL